MKESMWFNKKVFILRSFLYRSEYTFVESTSIWLARPEFYNAAVEYTNSNRLQKFWNQRNT